MTIVWATAVPKIKTARKLKVAPNTRPAVGQHPRRNDRGNGIRRVMEAINKIKGQGHTDQDEDQGWRGAGEYPSGRQLRTCQAC